MAAPYQLLEVAGDFIVAASGHELRTFNINNGTEISVWACPTPVSKGKDSSEAEPGKVVLEISPESETTEAGTDDPPTKRRKISDDEEEAKQDGKPAEEKKDRRAKAKQLRPPTNAAVAPNFIAVAVSKDAKHVVAVTGEDKHVRVFEHENGVLKQISERPMAKRPCAIALTADDSTIITADKFGDVFSLPLQVPEPSTGKEATKSASPVPQEPTKFVSEANKLTVHSARNRKALLNQLKQNLVKQEKTLELNDGKVLLLGHVSMLTDIALVERHGRSYIVTADRDEHIRVSRGIPQAHIIENYCFGHTDFVSKLCFPSIAPQLMISGGGNDDLYLWEWQSGKLLQKIDLIETINKLKEQQNDEKTKVVVNNIIHMPVGDDAGTIAVTCEGVPALLFFSLKSSGSISFRETLPLKSNALALTTFVRDGNSCFIVSVDTVHESFSRTELRKDAASIRPLEMFALFDNKVEASCGFLKPSESTIGEATKWPNLLYPLANLRKRAGEE